jgi:hypothetical protein
MFARVTERTLLRATLDSMSQGECPSSHELFTHRVQKRAFRGAHTVLVANSFVCKLGYPAPTAGRGSEYEVRGRQLRVVGDVVEDDRVAAVEGEFGVAGHGREPARGQ